MFIRLFYRFGCYTQYSIPSVLWHNYNAVWCWVIKRLVKSVFYSKFFQTVCALIWHINMDVRWCECTCIVCKRSRHLIQNMRPNKSQFHIHIHNFQGKCVYECQNEYPFAHTEFFFYSWSWKDSIRNQQRQALIRGMTLFQQHAYYRLTGFVGKYIKIK